MKQLKFLILFFVGLFLVVGCDHNSTISRIENKNLENSDSELRGVIYGQDSRFEATPQYAKITAAMAIFFPNSRLVPANSKYYFVKTESFAQTANLCPGERFAHQPIFGTCSGALVGPDLVLTAGHCVSAPEVCRDYSITFGWDVNKAKTGILSKDEIYRCQKILKIRDEPSNGYDYALIKLDRKVSIQPLKIAKKINPNFLLSASNPHGLPLKYDVAIGLEAYSPTMFKVKVDTSHSSSGSPLMDADGNIVGVLSMGNLDYYGVTMAGKTCYRLNVCKGNECTGQIYDNLKDLGPIF